MFPPQGLPPGLGAGLGVGTSVGGPGAAGIASKLSARGPSAGLGPKRPKQRKKKAANPALAGLLAAGKKV